MFKSGKTGIVVENSWMNLAPASGSPIAGFSVLTIPVRGYPCPQFPTHTNEGSIPAMLNLDVYFLSAVDEMSQAPSVATPPLSTTAFITGAIVYASGDSVSTFQAGATNSEKKTGETCATESALL